MTLEGSTLAPSAVTPFSDLLASTCVQHASLIPGLGRWGGGGGGGGWGGGGGGGGGREGGGRAGVRSRARQG